MEDNAVTITQLTWWHLALTRAALEGPQTYAAMLAAYERAVERAGGTR